MISAPAQTSHVRYRVVAFTVALAGVTYLDRACIGVLAPQIQADLGLNNVQMSYVFSAFTLAYGLFEMPTAWWADRIGSRKVLTRIVLWWSAFTMLTGAAVNYWQMLVTRFLFGVGEAGAWPNAGRIFSRWIPITERGRVMGVFFVGAHMAGGLTPLIAAWLAQYLPWRPIFLVFGAVGVVWAFAFYRWFRDEPREHTSVSAAERDLIESTRGVTASHHSGSLASLFANPSVLPLCIQYFANTYGTFFCLTWLPTYLITARGMRDSELAIFSGLPMMLATVADLSGGITTDRLARRMGMRLGNRAVGVAGYFVAAAALVVGATADDGRTAGIMISVAFAMSMFTLPPSWNTAMALGGENAGFMGAVMNTAGQVGGFLSPIVLAYIVDGTGDWSLPLHVLSALWVIAGLCWFFIRPERKTIS